MKRKKDERITITIRLNDSKTKEKLQKIAQENNTFVNEICNVALENHCKKHYKES